MILLWFVTRFRAIELKKLTKLINVSQMIVFEMVDVGRYAMKLKVNVSMKRVVQFIVVFCFAVLFLHLVDYLFTRIDGRTSSLPWRLTRLQFEGTFICVSILFALESMWRKLQQHQQQLYSNQGE